MKKLLLAGLLLSVGSGCSKKDDANPGMQPQLLVGTWSLAKYTQVWTTPSGAIVYQDSIRYTPPSALYGMTYKADGTNINGLGATGTYTYTPPTISYGVVDPTTTREISQLTAQAFVLTTQTTTSTRITTSKHYYVK